ncbi:MAG: hypothetical protein BA066_06010 [Candidatus Korarchaeota archaeon NZ13-K]|nr:MAG: hypothetical protein BA066_06010 [Candidatus Korarchaeota archaeon NZ13-K]
MSEQEVELKRRFLKLLKEDEEFRYAVAGFLGLDELLARLDSHERILEDLLREIRDLREGQGRLAEGQEKLWIEVRRHSEAIERLAEGQEKLWIEVRRHSEAIERLREDFNKMLDRIARIEEDQLEFRREQLKLRRSVRRLEKLHKELRGEMYYGFSQLSKFAGVTFEEFVRTLLTQRFRESGIIPQDRELRAEVIDGEEIDLFCEEPLIVGEVTAHAESAEELYKLLRKVEAAEKAHEREAERKILIVLTAPRQVAREIERLCEEHDVELVIGRVL